MKEIYYSGQRWISETEPQLGIGIVLSSDQRRVNVSFPAAETSRTYTVAAAPLRRLRFRIGDAIQSPDATNLTVTATSEDENTGLITYICDTVELSERNLPHTLGHLTTVQRLLNGLADSVKAFDGRMRLHMQNADIRRSPLRGFMGGRIDLLPHQLFIADAVAARRLPRALLADETGLGKTIEACLIIHRLMQTGRAIRVLILVPQTLVHQWFVELLRRFNASFRIFSPEYCSSLNKGNNPFLSDQQGIVDIDFLAGKPPLADMAVKAGWDLIVVDEAHHLQKTSKAYALVEKLAAVSPGVLLLTATPEQLGREDHFLRLRILDPQRYGSYEAYEAEFEGLFALSRKIDAVLAERKIDLALSTPESIMLPFPVLDEADGQISLADIIDRYGVGRSIFRNTRHTVAGFPGREPVLVSLKGGRALLERLAAEITADSAGQNPDSAIDAKDPRILWLADLVREKKNEKILVICTTQNKAIAIQTVLQKNVRIDIALFHEEMTILQRDRNAAWFGDEHGAQVLVCSEIGSEGRNFQFCHSLVLFDLPMEPELLEQRIGRLDRIGQTSKISLFVPVIENSPQQLLCRWYHESLDAFRTNAVAAGRVYEAVKKPLVALLTGSEDGLTKKIHDAEMLIARSKELCESYTGQLHDGRDRLLEIASFESKKAAALRDAILKADLENPAREILTPLLKHYGIAAEDAGSGKLSLMTDLLTDHAFPLPRRERPVITFDRPTALAREDVEFITIDHPMLLGALDLYLSTDHGTTAFAHWEDKNAREFLLEAVFVVECIAPARLCADRYLPPMPLRIVVDHTGADKTGSVPAGDFPSSLKSISSRALLASPKISDTIIPRMVEAVRQIALVQAGHAAGAALIEMRKVIDPEQERAEYLRDRSGANAERELICLREEKQLLEKHLAAARPRLDALRIIWHGPKVGG